MVDDRRKLRRRRIDRQTELERLPFAERLAGVERGRHVKRRRADDRIAAHDLFHNLRRRDGDHVQYVELVRVVRARHVMVAFQLVNGGSDFRRVLHFAFGAIVDLRHHDRRLRLRHLDGDLLRLVFRAALDRALHNERAVTGRHGQVRRHTRRRRDRERLALRERYLLSVVPRNGN